MAGTLANLRSSFKSRSYVLFGKKLLSIENNFSDDSSKKHNLYETLRIPSNATHHEIKKAYYDLTKKYHPDRNDNSEMAAIKFREVTEAYEILGNFSLRKRYDRGAPLPQMKKAISVPIDHKAKYQEFYDSRTKTKDYTADPGDYGEFEKREDTETDASRIERKEESYRPPFGTQLVIVLFVSTLMLIKVIYQ